MANSISAQMSMTSTVDNMNLSIRSSLSTQTTSSNALGQSSTVTTASWSQLSTGSLSDIRSMAFYNDNTVYSASVIQIATGSAGQNVIVVLQPGDGALISWSGPITLFGRVVNAVAPIVNGVVQYQLQQS